MTPDVLLSRILMTEHLLWETLHSRTSHLGRIDFGLFSGG